MVMPVFYVVQGNVACTNSVFFACQRYDAPSSEPQNRRTERQVAQKLPDLLFQAFPLLILGSLRPLASAMLQLTSTASDEQNFES